MLMVIFGAGASYDSSRAHPLHPGSGGNGPGAEAWRPPCAKDLFYDQAGRFGEIITRYPQIHPILDRLREPLNERSVEQELQLLQDEAEGNLERNLERKRQLRAVRYYLRDLLFEVSTKWHAYTRFTNYAPLIDQIMHFRKEDERVSLVTFNYDLLLDQALISRNYKLQEPARQFEAHEFLKLFKPHGSVDWARYVGFPFGYADTRFTSQQLIEDVTILPTKAFIRVSNPAAADAWPGGRTALPAIAVPFQTKTEDTFEWPDSHRIYFEELLRSVKKILVVGWQGREAHFLQMLRDRLPMRGLSHLMVVGANERDAWATLKNLAAELQQMPPHYSVASGGFTQFVSNREGEPLFSA